MKYIHLMSANSYQPNCYEFHCIWVWSNSVIYLNLNFWQMERIVEMMQDESTGVPVRTVKSFMSKVPSVFTGKPCRPEPQARNKTWRICMIMQKWSIQAINSCTIDSLKSVSLQFAFDALKINEGYRHFDYFIDLNILREQITFKKKMFFNPLKQAKDWLYSDDTLPHLPITG